MLTNFDLIDEASKMRINLVGVFSKDKLPYKRNRRDGGYIINLEDDLDVDGNPNQGTHWTCFIVKGKNCCYFDPFGIIMPRQVVEFLSDLKPIPYNSKQIQNIKSQVCGWYCIYFLYWFTRQNIMPFSKRLEFFVKKFDDNDSKNERLLEKYLNKSISKE